MWNQAINSFPPMKRLCFQPRLVLFLVTLILGQVTSFGQYYPPAVTVSGLDTNPLLLGGGGGNYSGGYYSTYSYDTVVEVGYWDYTTYYHYETQDQGYWDTTPGYYDDQGNWVPDNQVWVPNPVSVLVYDPTWIVTGSTTVTQTVTAWMSVSLTIGTLGNMSISSYNSNTGGTDSWSGSYAFGEGIFSAGLIIMAVSTDGSSWSPPAPPPSYQTFGPASIWVEGTRYLWNHTDYADANHNILVEYFTDGSGHTAWFLAANGDGSNSAGGDSPNGVSWSGTAKNGVFETAGGIDVRAGDSNGNYLQANAPTGLPPAVRVDGSSSLWNFIGQGGSSLYHYAGDQPHQRLTIEAASGVVSIQDDSNISFYSQNVMWNSNGGRDVRAVSLGGSLCQTDQSPSWGPPDVLVNQALWRYVGTWNGSATFPGSSPPAVGDHYLGDNNGQRLVVDASGNVTVFVMGGTYTGTYAPQTQQASAPRVFTVSGCDIFPGDDNGAYYISQPAVGPPAVWVNGVTFAYSSSNKGAAQLGNWVDTYVDGDNNYLLVSFKDVLAFKANGSSNWSGYYVPSYSNLDFGGIFVVVNGSSQYEVRASGGVTLLPPQGSPLNNHPNVVKVDGVAWKFAGSTSDTDYYFGTAAGERLWIDATGAVNFTNTVNSPYLSGAGQLSGSVFLVEGHDLRACTSDTMAAAPVGPRQWGPAALWVEGEVWSYIGTVSNNSLQLHADFYGGANAGQVVTVNSAMEVSGAYTGRFDGGVFVINGGADLRALDSTGAQIVPVVLPSNGRSTSLRIGGLHWNFLGTSGGLDYYAAPLGGQRLSIDASGAVVYSDHPHNVNNATGNYAGGTFTAISGGMSFNAGTIGSDLDILGNIVSFGALTDNAATAGVTLQFQDKVNSDGFYTASMFNMLARPKAQWQWARAADSSGQTTLPMMQLDASSKLTLYDTGGNPSMVLDPAFGGASTIRGVLRVLPSGDLPMALEFQQGAHP